MKITNFFAAFIIITFAVFIVGSQFADSFFEKISYGAISALIAIYPLLNLFWKNSTWMQKVNMRLSRIPVVGSILVRDDKLAIGKNDYKLPILQCVLLQCKERLSQIKSTDIFTNDFDISPIFIEGTDEDDKYEDWQFPPNAKRFSVITGARGSGKSFELVKRATTLCEALEKKRKAGESLAQMTIPLYIELGTLTKALDDSWLRSYVYKTCNLSQNTYDDKNVRVEKKYIQAFLNNTEDIAFFFDGFDEIPEKYRKESLEYIFKLARKTSVTIACIKDVYSSLNTFLFDNARLPSEYFFIPLSKKSMIDIVDKIKSKTLVEREEMKTFIDNKTTDIKVVHNNIFAYAQEQELRNPHSSVIVFSLFIKVFNNLSPTKKSELLKSDLAEMLNILWENYEDTYMIKNTPQNSDILGLRTYAVWIAKIMKESPFYVESLQPGWLNKVKEGKIIPANFVRGMYYLITRVLSAIIVGFALECIACTPFSLLSNSILGGIVIYILAGIYKKTNVNKRYEWLAKSFFLATTVTLLVSVCSIFQGYSVPRYNTNGQPSMFSLYEMWPGILLGLILSIIFSYHIIIEKVNGKYIQPVSSYQFKTLPAIGYALLGGGVSALFVGFAGWYVWLRAPDTIFIKDWLVPTIKKLWEVRLGKELLDAQVGRAVFGYGFTVAFTVICILIMILVGQYKSDFDTERDAAKQKLQFGIKAWMYKALYRAVIVFIISGTIYFFAMLAFEMKSWFHLVKISLGAAIASFIWYGGIDVINHALLVRHLSFLGIAPKQYQEWVMVNTNAGLIRFQGYKMAFYHPTLAKYYENQKLKDNPRIRLKKPNNKYTVIYIFCILSFVIMLFIPFIQRYGVKIYWPDVHQVYISQSDLKKSHWQTISNGTFRILRTGEIKLEAYGVIQVGTFVGLVMSPRGTDEGYMGLPLNSSYNLPGLDTFKHAALLFRRSTNNGRSWSNYEYVCPEGQCRKTLNLVKGEIVEFTVNDKEYHNNIGRYKLRLKNVNKYL